MKKNIIYIIITFSCMLKVHAQTPRGEELIGLNNVPTTELTNVAAPIIGSILYNPTDEKVYVYTTTGWTAIEGGEKSNLQFDENTGILNLTAPLTSGNSIDLESYVRIAPTKEITGNYTLTAADTGHIVYCSSATDITLTIPSGLPVGFNVSVYQYGTGKITYSGSGSIVNNRLNRFKSAGQYAGVGIVSYILDEFNLTGDLRK